MQDASACEKVVVVHAELLFRLVPENREWAVAVNVRFVHDPIAETAQHWDNGKLVFARTKDFQLLKNRDRIERQSSGSNPRLLDKTAAVSPDTRRDV